MAQKKVLKRAAISALGTAVFLVLAEFALRASDFRYPPEFEPIAIWNRVEDRDLRLGRGLHASATRQLWAPRPGAEVPWGKDETINSAGYRGPLVGVEKRPGVLRIATLGDSSTFGHSVPYGSTYSAQLEGLLRARGVDCEVIDAGVIGFTLRQGLERYRVFVRQYRPNIVIEAFGAVNDHHQAHMGVTDKKKIENNMQAAGFLSELGLRMRTDLRTVHLLWSWIDRARGVTADDRHQSFKVVRRLETQRKYMGQADWRGTRRVPLEDFDLAMAELKAEVEADGAKLLMLSMPRKARIEEQNPILLEYSQHVVASSGSLGVRLADGRNAFKQVIEAGTPEKKLFADNYHPKHRGHRVLATILTDVVMEMIPAAADH